MQIYLADVGSNPPVTFEMDVFIVHLTKFLELSKLFLFLVDKFKKIFTINTAMDNSVTCHHSKLSWRGFGNSSIAPIIVHQSIFKFIFGEKLFKRANFSSFSFFFQKNIWQIKNISYNISCNGLGFFNP